MLDEVYIFKDNSIILPDKIKQQVDQFCDKMRESSAQYYLARRKANPGKVYEQIKVGKLAEFAARSYLVQNLKLPGDVVPDLQVYEHKNKNWEPDLKYIDYSIHIKSCTVSSAETYGESYTYQAIDPLLRTDAPRDYCCFVLYDDKNDIYNVRSLVKINWLRSHNLFKEMKLTKFKNNKVAIYHEDLVNAAM